MNNARTDSDSGTEADTLGIRRADLPGLAAIFAQLALIALVLRKANIETFGFHRIIYIVVFGFVVNHLLPRRFRMIFFLALSLLSMAVALGGGVASKIANPELGITRAASVFCIGVILIAICRLPIGFWKRGTLLLFAGAVAAVFRSGKWESQAFAVTWPVVASLFMFRIIVYLYEISTSAQRPTEVQSLAYFFLTPNFCTLLFPVIDFRTFCRTYYNEADLVIYQRGIKWMTRGIIQLVGYRMVDQVFALDALNVRDGSDLIRFVVTNVFLYLKVSGSFHLFIGVLLLFGFNLPETNHRYFLASSFTDYWRRVNIYWRNFLMKVFFYPTFFRLKGLGQIPALIVATLWSFLVTWALHIYQTWWIKGDVSWSWTDALFWMALAGLVLANSLWELKRNRKRRLSDGRYTRREAIGKTIRTVLTFSIITLLWSLWSTPTLGLWFHIWSLADRYTLFWGAAVLACVGVATLFLEILPFSANGSFNRPIAAGDARRAALGWDAVRCALPLFAIFAAACLSFRFRLEPAEIQNYPVATVLAQTFTESDQTGQGRSYYENLTSADKGSSQFWESMTAKFNATFALSDFTFENDSNVRELKPNVHIEVDGMHIDTNRWGMRDRDHALAKPSATLRMAILGSSHVMGYGLPAGEMFEPILEERLNRRRHFDGNFELLNFAVSGQSPLGQIWMLQHRVFAFHPDMVMFVAHVNDFDWATRDVEADLRRNVALPPGFPSQLFAQANVTNRTIEAFAMRRLKPQQSHILSFCYQQIVQECQSIHALPVCIFLPVPSDLPLDRAKASALLRIADEAGFVTVDLSDIFAGYKPNELMLHDIGNHANAKAQALIANALYDRLSADPRIEIQSRAQRIGATLAAGALTKRSSD
jgi:D-alanyl-lipoteichoic acid acyltransferase DltB (MBOAT superfamily)